MTLDHRTSFAQSQSLKDQGKSRTPTWVQPHSTRSSQSLKDQGKSRTDEAANNRVELAKSQSLKDQGKSRTAMGLCFKLPFVTVAIP